MICGQEKTYVEDNEKDKIEAVQNDQDPEKPPSSRAREEQGETSTWMVKQKLEFLPDSAVTRNKSLESPNDEAEHTRESGISDDDQE